ncbi:MAG: PAS domain-containing protein [Proteobacteria bacterium]|nr:PAS domain-containing protein [Pseudomonadota bacterium]
MKHPSSQAVYAHWNERRGTRAAPERAEIDPAAIRRALGDTIILAADFVETWRFRLAGTRVCALFNREIKGESLAALWREEDQKTLATLTETITVEKTGAVMGLVGRTDDGAEVDLEMLMLPLAHTGHARIRGLGVLAPSSPPYWLGSKPVTELRLMALRHIGPDIDGLAAGLTLAPAQVPEPAEGETAALHDGGRRRHGFVVYSGGREIPPEKVG